jgi:hypothetical protein
VSAGEKVLDSIAKPRIAIRGSFASVLGCVQLKATIAINDPSIILISWFVFFFILFILIFF